MITRKIFVLLGAISLSTYAYGAEVKSEKKPIVSDFDIKLGAFLGFESGGSNQSNRKGKENNISANRSDFAFYNDVALYALISKELDDIEYGGKVILVPTAKQKVLPSYNGSHVFVKSDFGRVELGSPIPVAANMMISSGSIPSKYINLRTAHMKQGKESAPSFLTSNECFLGDSIKASTDKAPYSNEPPRTINYYTPKWSIAEETQVQFGISYTPDTSNTGADSPSSKSDSIVKKTIGENGAHKFEVDNSVKDAFSAGISLENKLSEENSFKVAVTGEYGKAVGYAKKYANKDDKDAIAKHKLSNLRSYNIGGELKLGNIKYSGCYGSHGNSLTTSELHKSGRNTHYYSFRLSHDYNKLTTDIVYFASEKFKNKIDSIQLRGTYAMAQGLKPYASVTHFLAKGKPEYYGDLKAKKTKGLIFVVGANLTL